MTVAIQGTTKSGRPYVIRQVELTDVASAHAYINRLSQERTYVRVQGEEVTLEQEQKFIEKQIKNIGERKGVCLVLECDGTVQGICNLEMRDKTESHTAELGIGLDASVRGEGLGRIFMQAALDEAAKLPGIKAITLKVKGPNDLAKSLYEKLGFIQYGVLPGGTMHRDEPVDQIYMYKMVV